MGAGGTITVLGLGDILLQDEGFGVHFVCWLSQRRRFDGRAAIVDGGTLGYNFLDTICSSGHVIVLDVIRSDAEPGTLYRFSREEMELAMPGPTRSSFSTCSTWPISRGARPGSRSCASFPSPTAT
jgi:hydrogenase maturation protease